jgi:NodT family efflux transporter outer membrane factor (OMF) lipoprotein
VNRSARPALALLAVAALSGCATRTAYRQPAVPIAQAWPHADQAEAAQAQDWWKAFGDPRLDALVARVLERNNNLAKAALAVQRARLGVGLAVVNPAVTGSVTANRTYPLSGPLPDNTFAGGSLQASYEIDLFGKLAAERDAARFEANASQQDLDSARIALIASTVDLYFQLGFLNQRVTLAGQSISYARRTLDLVEVQRGAGAVSGLETALAEQSLAAQEAGLHDLMQQRVAARNALSNLLGGEGADPAEELAALPDQPPPAVAAGLPAELLSRRPDLRAAELRLREQLAQTDVSRLSFYPSFGLTGSLGTSSPTLADILTHPTAVLGAGVTLPFLQVDQMRLTIRRSKIDYESAVLGFRQTLIEALAEVDSALSARTQLALQAEANARSLDLARKVERLDEVNYRTGSMALKFWLDAQESRRQAEVALAQNRLSQLTNYVAICEALGDGPPSAGEFEPL